MDAVHVARVLGGEVAGRNRILCPGPGHSRIDRSLSVRLDQSAPGGFRVHSFADDPWQDCRDHVRERMGLDGWRPREGRACIEPQIAPDPVAAKDEAIRTARALALWDETIPIAGTPAERYLAGRGLAYGGEALRWHPACPFGRERLGCMVALVRNVFRNEPQAIHRTAIDADGTKIGRLSLGPIAGGAVKLTDDADVTLALGIGEGIETALSLARIVGLPVWATVTAGNLATFPVLPGIESLWIAVDNDKSGTGERAAQNCIDRQEAAGVETITATPQAVGADLNDGVHRHAG